MIFQFRKRSEADQVLDRVVTACRSALPAERLSSTAHGQIVRKVLELQEAEPLPTYLRSAAWRVLAGALPVAAVVLLAFLLADRPGLRGVTPRLSATKVGDQVVFTIANGGTPHQVYKSSVPNNFAGSDRLQVRAGSFRDSVDDGSGLVFYRIE